MIFVEQWDDTVHVHVKLHYSHSLNKAGKQ